MVIKNLALVYIDIKLVERDINYMQFSCFLKMQVGFDFCHCFGHLAKEYRTSRIDCGPCPFRTSCIGKSPEKKIVDTLDKPYYDKMHERLKGSYARKMKKLRQSTVEPVLGTLINFLAMKRVNTRGINLANKCMLLAAIAYNLKKILKFKTKRVMTAVLQLPEETDQVFTSLFLLRSISSKLNLEPGK